MSPYMINARIRDRGSSQKQLAAALGVTVQAVSGVIRGRIRSRAIAAAVSKAAGVPVSRLYRAQKRGTT